MEGKFRPKIPILLIVGVILAVIGVPFLKAGIWAAGVIRRGQIPEGMQNPVTFKWVFFGVGALFLVLGLSFAIPPVLSLVRQWQAFCRGVCYYAEFLRVEPDLHVTVNGRHPFIAVLQYVDDSGQPHEVRADAGLKDPTAKLSGMQTPVYADPENPENYYVDLQSVL